MTVKPAPDRAGVIPHKSVSNAQITWRIICLERGRQLQPQYIPKPGRGKTLTKEDRCFFDLPLKSRRLVGMLVRLLGDNLRLVVAYAEPAGVATDVQFFMC